MTTKNITKDLKSLLMDDFQYFPNSRVIEPDLFADTLSLQTPEVEALFRHLVVDVTSRSETLKALRRVLKKSSNVLPQLIHKMAFTAIHDILLHDHRPAVVAETLWLVVDILPSLGGHVDSCVSPLLPLVTRQLGSDSQDVKRASLRLLHVFMRYTNNLQKCLKTLIQYGVEGEESAQRGTVLSLPLLFTEEFSRENLFLLVESLGQLLVTSDASLFYPTFLALQRLQAVVGDNTFGEYFSVIPEEIKTLYESVVSRNSSANRDRPTETLLATNSDRKSVKIREDLNDSSEGEVGYTPATKYGLFPTGLIVAAMSSKTEDKLVAIQSVLQVVREVPIKRLSSLLPWMDEFLRDFVSDHLLEQNSFKVTLSSLDIIEILVERLKTSMTPFMPSIVAILSKRLGDQRTVIRDSVIKVLHQLMYTFPPQDMIDILLTSKPSKNPKIREEVINRVTAAVLTFPRSEFNLARLCFSISPMLTDNRRMVRLSALECLSVLAQALGHHQLSPLMAAVEAIESNCECEGLVAALQARLARRSLPRCAADGTVRYVLNPANFSGWFTSSTDADLEWIMLATPSSHGGTPPKTNVTNKKASQIPLGNIPFDRRRSTVVPPTDDHVDRRKSLAETTIDHLLVSGQTADGTGGLVEERAFLDAFRGESFNSEDFLADDDESRASSLEMWREYFSRFRKQLAEAVISGSVDNESTVFQKQLENGFHRETGNSRRKSEFTLPVQTFASAQDITSEEFQRTQSPQQSSSAPSTASADIQYLPPMEQIHQIQVLEPIERSMSLPSIGGHQMAEEEEEEDIGHDHWTHEEVVNEETREEIREEIRRSVEQMNRESAEENKMATKTPEMSPRPEEENNERNEATEDKMADKCEPSSEPPVLSVQEATPLHHRRSSSVAEPLEDKWREKDETLSSENNFEVLEQKKKVFSQNRRKRATIVANRGQSRSQSPQYRRRASRAPQQIYIKTTPAIPINANIRHILVNVAKTEGPFESPLEAVKAATMALQDDAWTTKVEGMLAVTRLATFHPHSLLKDQHQIIRHLVAEVKNLRSTVSRSAIFTIGELFLRLKSQIEPEMDSMVTSLLLKSGENVVFIREDIERALSNCCEEMPSTRAALALINNGSSHRNTFVRKTCAQFLSLLVDKMGAIKCLLGPRDIGEHLLPAVARAVQDQSPHTRYYGRRMFHVLMTHQAFEKLLRKHVTPGTYRNIVGILEAIKRRGVGDRPPDMTSPMKMTPIDG